MKSKNPKPITVDVMFPTALDRNQIGKVVTDLLQTLLHQRNQIPLQYDVLSRDVKQFRDENSKEIPDDMTSTPTGRRSREEVRNDREVKRKQKTRQRYLSSAAKFVDSCEEIVGLIRNVIREDDNVAAVSFLLGATSLHPRESYTVKLPTSSTNHTSNSSNGVGVHLFRAMVTNDRLFGLTSTRLSVSNMFIVFHMKEILRTAASPLNPLDSFQLHPSCVQIEFNLEVTPEMRPVAARLRFDSGSTDCMTKSNDSPMVMSTPGPRSLSASPPSYRIFRSKNETSPSKRSNSPDLTRTSRKVITMDLCTPAGVRRGSEDMILCTPLTTPRMVLCTPAESHLDIGTTPGLKRLDLGKNKVLDEEELEVDMQKAALSSQGLEGLNIGLLSDQFVYYIITNPLRGFKY